jgi:hypothetical protein
LASSGVGWALTFAAGARPCGGNGIPLPPFTNGTYNQAQAEEPFWFGHALVGEGNRQLREAWKAGKAT